MRKKISLRLSVKLIKINKLYLHHVLKLNTIYFTSNLHTYDSKLNVHILTKMWEIFMGHLKIKHSFQ